MLRARDNSFFIMYLSYLTSKVYLLVNIFQSYVAFSLPWITFVLSARENTFLAMYLSPLKSSFTFWLTFFQSYRLPLFFNGLLSYLIGMKRRTSGHVTCKRNLVQAITPLLFELI